MEAIPAINQENKNRQVALLVETSLSSGRGILTGIGCYAHEQGNWHLYHLPRGLLERPPEWMARWRGDGVIARISDQATFEALRDRKIPVVDALGIHPHNQFPVVHTDDDAIGRLVADYFRTRGYSYFAFYGIHGENWSVRRRDAFHKATNCGKGRFHCLETRRSTRDGSTDAVIELRHWLAALPKPVALMLCSDQRAIPLFEACRAEGIGVPEEVAVMGVDNDVPLCNIAQPQLSSVRAGHALLGYRAAELLQRLMDGSPPPSRAILVPPREIIERLSSDMPALEDPAIAAGVRFIFENLCSHLTNEHIARASGLSRTNCQRRFKDALGLTIHDFILDQRIRRVRRLLRNPSLTLPEVAELAGFRHQEYMGAVLKKELGLTPGALRDQILALRQSTDSGF